MGQDEFSAQLELLTNIVLALIRSADREQRHAALDTLRECAFRQRGEVARRLLERLGQPVGCHEHAG